MGTESSRFAVRAQGLSKIYGSGASEVRALDDVSLEIPLGELVVMLGPSGSGKTTLLNLIGALEPPTSGLLEVFGRQLADLDEAERTAYRLDSVGFIFQMFNLVPTLTAHENVELLAEMTGPESGRRTDEALSRIGLTERANHFPAQLSGGEQQRVAIARGLVKRPRLLLCDEPTGALDIETGKRILELLRELADGEERTVVCVTHNAAIARMADRVVRLRDGRITEVSVNESPVAADEVEW